MAVGKKQMVSGFTLIELLVTIAVMAIIATIAIPGFQSFIASNRFAADYNSILAGMNYARAEAVKRRGDVLLEMSASGSTPWALEVKSVVSGAESTLRVIQASDDIVAISPNDFSVTFNFLGRRKNCSDPCELTVSYQKEETIEIDASGKVSRQ